MFWPQCKKTAQAVFFWLVIDCSPGFVPQGRLQHEPNEAIYPSQRLSQSEPLSVSAQLVKNKSCERGIILPSKRRVF